MKKIILSLILFLSIFSTSFAGNTNIDFKKWWAAQTAIENTSIEAPNNTGNLWENVNQIWRKVLGTFKFLLGWLLVIYMVYIGVVMILSMWDDEEKLSSAKKQLWYALIWLLFINIPGTLYDSFDQKEANVTQQIGVGNFVESADQYNNIFINPFALWATLEDNIIGFLKAIIFFLAIFLIIYEWVKMIASRGNDEDITNSKQKIFYSILWLIFIWVMEAWKNLAFSGDIWDGKNLFQSLANLALYFAGPIAIFFLSLAGYYFITAAGDEEKIKKAKSIVINTILATLILLWMYTFLLDIAGLSFWG